MKKFNVTLTAMYNGNMTVEASGEEEALQIAQESIQTSEVLERFPDYVEMGDGGFSFGEATADYAQEISE